LGVEPGSIPDHYHSIQKIGKRSESRIGAVNHFLGMKQESPPLTQQTVKLPDLFS
jgi:hypothetical protein